MRNLLLLIALAWPHGPVLRAQSDTDSYSRGFEFGKSGGLGIDFYQSVVSGTAPWGSIHRVFCGVGCRSPDDAILAGGPKSAAFGEGESIGPDSWVQASGPTGAVPEFGVLSYIWEMRQPGNSLVQTAVSDPFAGLVDVVLGFRLGKGDVARFGWVRLHRDHPQIAPQPGPETGVAAPFVPVGAALNPFPGRPIQAGRPPELPSLRPSIVTDNGDGRRLRLRWPDGFAGVRLERTASLDVPVAWEPVETSSNDVRVPAPPEGAAYFRLAYDF